MDPTSDPPPPPTAVPFTAEPPNNNHVPTAADANSIPNHPPYDEMIYTAIGALKEKNGSSKRAIGKYIQQVYKNLPTTHSALLTHHLNRLRSVNLLVMVKKSYKLPGSDNLPPSPPSQVHKTRGRPPKPKPQPTADPVWASLGLSDDPNPASAPQSGKRGPGRPRKILGLSPGSAVPVRRGRPPGSTGKSKVSKRAGRPPKPKSVSGISSGLKRRGRPPKAKSNLSVIPFASPVAPGQPTMQPIIPTVSVPNGSPRPRGRPRKIVPAGVAPPLTLTLAADGGAARGRGRPRGVFSVMTSGRLQKLAVGRAKNPARRPVGRPKGSTAAAITAHKAANEDLRKKLEHFQTKVKESLGMLKPYFNHESPVTAIAAIQELEVLSTLDLKAALRDETQQQPEPLPLPQTQVYEQQYPPQPQAQPQLQEFFQTHTSAQS
ncbi:wiskott-Aldrich syndrome protein homolog 1-like [Vigna unguiculata]|uniref:wiskott-Aldrich syndrome protein homolog 1-like n=1 Tax=Vigna unguiculata TaxID=3917 RepID=UPI00101609E5|nr:wiskott-Aldrich syndrome protein homolog 1-like [Vigna unguiculata]